MWSMIRFKLFGLSCPLNHIHEMVKNQDNLVQAASTYLASWRVKVCTLAVLCHKVRVLFLVIAFLRQLRESDFAIVPVTSK